MAASAAVAVPAVVGSLAYLQARWRLQEDWRSIISSRKANKDLERRAKVDRVNQFYVIEDRANDPKTANKTFIIYHGKTWTFRQTYELSLRYAGWLHSKYRIGRGDYVAIDLINCPEYMFICLALWSLSAVPALVNYNLLGDSFLHMVRTSSARLLILDPELESKLMTPEVKQALDSPTFRKNSFPIETVSLTPGLRSSLDYFPPYRASDSSRSGTTDRDICVLIGTSGTTGLPKAATMPNSRAAVGSAMFGYWMGIRPVTSSSPDRYYSPMPLYHTSAFVVAFLMCLNCAVTFVVGRRFSVSTFWKDVIDNDATTIQYVGEILRYLLAAPPQPNDRTKHNVRMAFGNGLRPDVWDRFRDRFGVNTIAEFYSATEGVGGSLNFSRNTFSSGAIGASGAFLAYTMRAQSVLVEVDWDTETPRRSPTTGFCQKAQPNQPGERIYILDPKDIAAKYTGYLGNDAATKSKILQDVFEKGDMWYRTGDVLRVDSERRVWFMDRIGDTFRWKSENVSTSEVAEALGNHPQVREANVYGVQLPGHEGRAGCAAIVLADNALQKSSTGEPKPDVLESLATWCSNSLPRYAVPVFLRIVTEMVATGNGKQQKTSYRKEGVDPKNVGTDRLFWFKPGSTSYEPFGELEWKSLTSGGVKL